jgi:hypothetical protein
VPLNVVPSLQVAIGVPPDEAAVAAGAAAVFGVAVVVAVDLVVDAAGVLSDDLSSHVCTPW